MIVRMVRRRFPFVAALPALLAVGSAPALAADRTGALPPVRLKTSAAAARVAFAPVVRVIDGNSRRSWDQRQRARPLGHRIACGGFAFRSA